MDKNKQTHWLQPSDDETDPTASGSTGMLLPPANVWTDELSRQNLKKFAHRRHERLRFSPESLARSGKCLTLNAPAARWREKHIAAANT